MIIKVTVKAVDEHLRLFVRQVIYETYVNELGIYPDKDGLLDIWIIIDGTWKTPGFSSTLGCGIAIEAYTGLLFDYEAFSRICYTCTLYENKKKKNLIAPDEYAKWKESHKDNCNRNWWDSSGAMEVEAASRIYGRSIEKYKMIINTMISDGDSKSFKRVTEDKPYGEKYIIKKKECVQHAAKREGKRFCDFEKRSRTM